MSSNDGEPQSKKPEDSDFQQQRLKAWQPLLTPKWVIGTFILIGVVFIPIGAGIIVSSAKVTEQEIRYDNRDSNGLYVGTANSYPATCTTLSPAGCVGEASPGTSSSSGSNCTIGGIDYQRTYTASDSTVANVAACSIPVSFTLEHDMDAPVYFYYKLSNYYQNHRRYVKSRSDTQLAGDSSPDLSTCSPWKKDDTTNSKTYYPCGLIAGSFFVDRFSAVITRSGVTDPVVNGTWWKESDDWQKKGIAWKSDVNDKFKVNEATLLDTANFNFKGILDITLPPVDDEDFIVWMRTAGLPTFKKLYRKINVDLKKGDSVTINTLNYYPVSQFSGQKSIVLSTTSWLGGKNSFLGWAYVVVGIICFVLAIAFAIKHAISPRPLGDMKYFNWPSPSRQ